jgi:dihydrodipicolinate synthase/N-acetylneuraminate lyase
MNRDELKQLIQGPIATVPTAMDDHYRLDLDTMAELTRWWVDQGLVAGRSVIKVAAAMGEGPDLTDDEWPRLLDTAVKAADGKAAVMCGLKPKDTLHTIEDGKRAADLGAIGLQIDLPFFHHPTQDDMVRFYSDISDGVDIGIMIYNTLSTTPSTSARRRSPPNRCCAWPAPSRSRPSSGSSRSRAGRTTTRCASSHTSST